MTSLERKPAGRLEIGLRSLLALLLFGFLSPPGAEARVGRAWSIGAGAFDIARDHPEAQVDFEYRFPEFRWGVGVSAGLMVTEEESIYVYGSFRREFALSGRWSLTPSLGGGLYEKGDEGKDLGEAIEFRSALELARRVGENAYLGLTFYHLSNASISSVNPGSNSLVVSYIRTLP